MAKRTFSCREISLDYDQMLSLRSVGALNLGVEEGVASRLATQGIHPTKTTASAAHKFWNFVGLAILLGTIYFSFTSRWWWFIPGVIACVLVWKANQKGHSENLLDAAMVDRNFYERVRGLNGWLYQIEETEAAKYKSS